MRFNKQHFRHIKSYPEYDLRFISQSDKTVSLPSIKWVPEVNAPKPVWVKIPACRMLDRYNLKVLYHIWSNIFLGGGKTDMGQHEWGLEKEETRHRLVTFSHRAPSVGLSAQQEQSLWAAQSNDTHKIKIKNLTHGETKTLDPTGAPWMSPPRLEWNTAKTKLRCD